MSLRSLLVAFFLGLLFITPLRVADADPCGMVPPLMAGGVAVPLQRIGVQRTYVFYRDGIETFVLRPGYRGQAEDFGMLIPFPSPPSVRKVPDSVFEQLDAAIDPPEVVVDLRPRPQWDAAILNRLAEGAQIRTMTVETKSAVRVLRQEAVGMYEVAVLAAGSAEALSRWMKAHGYRYPEGMDATCNDYVEDGWCFVAVKTRVVSKQKVDARPGQRSLRPGRGRGETFDGFVQAMGFRFRTPQLVVPMRLSAFNPGPRRNLMYVLSDGPVKVSQLPAAMVKRQIDGDELLGNLSEPLPLRVLGGTEKDIPQGRRRSLRFERDPRPRNGIAGELFASDLLAARDGILVHDHESREKRLLDVNEALGLRGGGAEELVAAAVKAEGKEATAASLPLLAGMTMTVLDGDFPQEVVAASNLTFDEFRMPRERNQREIYDVKHLGKPPRLGGLLPGGESPLLLIAWVAVLMLALVGAVIGRLRRRAGGRVLGVLLLVGVCAGHGLGQEVPPAEAALLEQLRAPGSSSLDALVMSSDEKVLSLERIAGGHHPLELRGRAIVALSRIEGSGASDALRRLGAREGSPPLLVQWVAAARIARCAGLDELAALTRSIPVGPVLARPLRLRCERLLAAEEAAGRELAMLKLLRHVPTLMQAGSGLIEKLDAARLVELSMRASDADDRRMASGLLSALARARPAEIQRLTLAGLTPRREAEAVPWIGGALFVPQLGWKGDAARDLAESLIQWMLWSERAIDDAGPQRTDVVARERAHQRQAHNVLNSIGLSRTLGYRLFGFSDRAVGAWLAAWRGAQGADRVAALLEAQGLEDDRRFAHHARPEGDVKDGRD